MLVGHVRVVVLLLLHHVVLVLLWILLLLMVRVVNAIHLLVVMDTVPLARGDRARLGVMVRRLLRHDH